MREIKFRAWDGADMVYFDLALCNSESPKWFDNTIWRNPVMQYTGLKDSNGVEIYEGDIISLTEEVNVVVGWNEDTAAFCAISKDGSKSDHSYGSGYCKVIGNIHQNPELLK